MHELSLLRGLVDVVADKAAGREVLTVGVRVGARSGVVVEALESAWPIARVPQLSESTRLEVEKVPATVYCPTCDDTVEIDEYFALLCPRCGTPTGDLRTGREFEVRFIDVE